MLFSLGAYDLLSELGRGAFGRVYRAVHRPTGAERAVKVFDGVPDPEALLRLEREASALARVGGEGIVPVHESGVDRGRHYLVLGLMPGGSLRARLRAEGRLPWREAVALVAKLARALERCHAAGVVHRDLKPDNVLFDDRGEPRLADFGIVRDLHASRLTETGQALGTPAYMAPEQLDGAPADARADVYGLGVILHELVAGSPPFASPSPIRLLAEKRSGKRPRLAVPGVPAGLEALLDRAIAPSLDARTGSAGVLARELDAVAGGVPERRGPSRAVLGVALLVGVGSLALAAAVAVPGRQPAPSSPSPAPSPVTAAPRETVEPVDRILARLRTPAAGRPELEKLIQHPRGAQELAKLVANAALLPRACFAPERPPSAVPDVDRDLARLEGLARLASATSLSDWRAGLAAIEAGPRPPTLVQLADAAGAVDRVARLWEARMRSSDPTLQKVSPDLLSRLDELRARPTLVKAAAYGLVAPFRGEVVCRLAQDDRTFLGEAIKSVKAFGETAVLAELPPELVVAITTFRMPEDVGVLIGACERLADRDPLLAAAGQLRRQLLGLVPKPEEQASFWRDLDPLVEALGEPGGDDLERRARAILRARLAGLHARLQGDRSYMLRGKPDLDASFVQERDLLRAFGVAQRDVPGGATIEKTSYPHRLVLLDLVLGDDGAARKDLALPQIGEEPRAVLGALLRRDARGLGAATARSDAAADPWLRALDEGVQSGLLLESEGAVHEANWRANDAFDPETRWLAALATVRRLHP